MHLDQAQLRLAARHAVSAGQQTTGEDRTLAALTAVRDLVPRHQMEQFWVALIEHSVNTLRPFLSVYGDEFRTGPRPHDPARQEAAGRQSSGHEVADVPLRLVNDALGHASSGDYDAVADVVRLMTALDDSQRAVALGNIVHMALVIGDVVNSRSTADDAG